MPTGSRERHRQLPGTAQGRRTGIREFFPKEKGNFGMSSSSSSRSRERSWAGLCRFPGGAAPATGATRSP